MKGVWLKSFTESLVALSTVAVLPTLAFTTDVIETDVSDAIITGRVRGAFLRNNIMPGALNVPLRGIRVETERGVVYLTGEVESAFQRATLIHLAELVDGVRKVRADVILKSDT